MFGRTIIRERTEYVTKNVNVREERAPTDESVKLLREMEEAADKRRLMMVKVEDNAFNGVVDAATDWGDMSITARCRFTLNGQELIAKASVDTFATKDIKQQVKLAEALRDAVAKEIANKMLAPLIGDAFKNAFGRRDLLR